MSIAELGASHYQDSGPESFDRTPPQDVVAEQSVLGGMMLSKDAIADVVEVLRGPDFYRPAHETIYDAIISLYGRGEPADAVTVSDELTKRGDLARVGGAPYLHTLISSVPTAANAGYYARIVRERAVLRRLVEAGTKIVQLGYAATGGDVDDLVNAAQAEVYAVTERGTSEDYLPIGQLIEATVDEIEAAGQHGDGLVGVPTGFADLDRLTNGLHPGQMIVVAARPAIGKALALDTPLPTPHGWTTMGAVRPGDLVLGADGRPTRVLRATDVMHGRPCYEVHFSDGSMIVADGQHQWLTETRASRKSAQAAGTGDDRHRNRRTFAEVRTTEELAATLRCPSKEQRLNHSVVNTKPLELPEREFLVQPYTLGAWLGGGTSAAAIITSDDPDIVMRLEADGLVVRPTGSKMRYSLRLPPFVLAERSPVPAPSCRDCGARTCGLERCQSCRNRCGTVQARLRTIGVLGNKHIPSDYLRGSVHQRKDLLAGLLDTDGTVMPTGLVQFTSTSKRLADDVQELVLSLGHRCGLSTRPAPGARPDASVAYTISFSTDEDVFWLPRKQRAHKERRTGEVTRRGSRLVTDVVPVDSVPVRCIEVANADHLYLAGRSMIPTHNSTLGLDIARSAAIRNDLATVIFSLEMSRTEITMRMLSAEARIPLQKLRQGRLDDTDWTKMARTMGELTDAPLFIDDSPNMSLMEIRAKCRRLKQRNDLKLVVIDYLQLMSSGKRVESRQQEVSEFSRAIKLLAKELEVPVIAISQLNRGSEQRTDKKPQMSDLRESGCLTRDTRIVRADTGAETTMGELFDTGATDVPVWSLDDSLRYVRRHLTHVFSTGVKPVFKLTLASGKRVRATGNHPFLTYDGWRPLEQLTVGTRLGVPRHLPAPEHESTWTDEAVTAAASRMSAPLAATTHIDDEIFHLPKRQIALLLRQLWREGGELRPPNGDDPGTVAWVGDPKVARAISVLLLRFGISVRVLPGHFTSGLELADGDDRRRFLQEIGAGDSWREAADALLQRALDETSSAPRRAQQSVWGRVERSLRAQRSGGGAASTALSGLARMLRGADLDVYAVNDVVWDPVLSIEPDGEDEVFDATVLGNHNFIANGISVHNSIEQDADMVILLHREDAYEKESPRAGEADFIVAKHRNGPTDTITVAFQGHYSRFVDMAQS